jgi:hypothetical protein
MSKFRSLLVAGTVLLGLLTAGLASAAPFMTP